LLALAVLLGTLSAGSQEIGTLTLLKDTPLHVIRGVSVLQGIEGMRLHAGDIGRMRKSLVEAIRMLEG
jgi:hypothetical protein